MANKNYLRVIVATLEDVKTGIS